MIITVGNINYNVKVYGSGKAVVFLHGFSEDMSTWKLNKLEGYKFIYIDMLGHGKSSVPFDKKHYKLKSILEHINKIIKNLEVVNYSVVGYSLGGRLALAYALKYQEEMDKLVVESASYGEVGLFSRHYRRKNDYLLAKDIDEKGVLWFNHHWSNLEIFKTQEDLPNQVKTEIENRRLSNNTTGLVNTLLTTGQGKFPCIKNKIKNLDLPVLYISGELDQKYTEMGADFKRLNPKVIHKVIENAGHNTHIESSVKFNQIVRLFLEGEK